jgi:succinoglycan biosynthesis protein ExoA
MMRGGSSGRVGSPPSGGTSGTPGVVKVTMVVAMYNEATTIRSCLESLAAQDYPRDHLEVIVLDGGSSDDSWQIAERLVAEQPGWLLKHNPRRIQAAAWNEGIRIASGDVVGIVSGHAQLADNYVRQCVETLKRSGADMVGGPVRAIGEGTIGEAVAVAMSTPFGVGGASHHYLTEPGEVDTVFMGVCRRATWLRFPFDESMVRNQDDEMSYRLRDAGGRIICDPAIESTYQNRSSLPAVWHQFFDYGRWKVVVLQRHPRQARIRHLIPMGLVVAVATSVPLATISAIGRVAAAAVLGLYGFAAVAASVRYGSRSRLRSSLALPIVYPTIHVAYGVGMILGLARAIAGRRGRVRARDESVEDPPSPEPGASAPAVQSMADESVA